MDELRITEWSISEAGHLTVKVVGELGMSDTFRRVLVSGPRTAESFPPVAATRSAHRPVAAQWTWRQVAYGNPAVRVPIERSEILDRLVLAHDPLGRIADWFGIESPEGGIEPTTEEAA